jgi:hypothetical protein
MSMVTLPPTAHFVVSYDDSIVATTSHPDGATLAQGVVDYCKYDYARLCSLFAVTVPPQCLPIAINIVPGGGGAQNDGLGAIPAGQPATITVFIADTISYPFTINPLVVAEEAEILMVVQDRGWNPVWSSGEALSRVSAQILYPPAAALTSTGSSWFNSSTYQNPADWVDNVEHTDQDFVSIGCGSLFLNYLAYQLDYTWPAIIGAAPTTGTLAETANILGVATPVYQNFVSLLQSSFPTGNLYPSTTPFLEQTDDVYPLGSPPEHLPTLYIRHNTSDDGTSHAPPLSDSPDIIYKNAPVADPQATYSTPASIASVNESDPAILTGQTNYLYLRVWNRGVVDAENVFATVYWSPPATLVTPSMWTELGVSYYPQVPNGSTVEVTAVGIPWPADEIPAAGHYCYVATVGNNYQPAPNPQSLAAFGSFQDYVNYIAANNDIAWHNFNVITVPSGQIKGPFGNLVGLPFLFAGAWTGEEEFIFETVAELPENSILALQVADWIGRGLVGDRKDLAVFRDTATDPANTGRVRITLPANGARSLHPLRLPAHTAAPSHLLVGIDPRRHHRGHKVSIRQLYKGEEVGRITWCLVPSGRCVE